MRLSVTFGSGLKTRPLSPTLSNCFHGAWKWAEAALAFGGHKGNLRGF